MNVVLTAGPHCGLEGVCARDWEVAFGGGTTAQWAEVIDVLVARGARLRRAVVSRVIPQEAI